MEKDISRTIEMERNGAIIQKSDARLGFPIKEAIPEERLAKEGEPGDKGEGNRRESEENQSRVSERRQAQIGQRPPGPFPGIEGRHQTDRYNGGTGGETLEEDSEPEGGEGDQARAADQRGSADGEGVRLGMRIAQELDEAPATDECDQQGG